MKSLKVIFYNANKEITSESAMECHGNETISSMVNRAKALADPRATQLRVVYGNCQSGMVFLN